MNDMHAVCGVGPGAMVEVLDGWMPVEWLEAGTPVRCRETGMQPIAGIIRLNYSGPELLQCPSASPVRVRAGSVGAGLPVSDLLLAPGQGVVRPEDEGLLPEPCPLPAARLGLPAPEGRASYALIALPLPDMILVEGLWMQAAPLSALHMMRKQAA